MGDTIRTVSIEVLNIAYNLSPIYYKFSNYVGDIFERSIVNISAIHFLQKNVDTQYFRIAQNDNCQKSRNTYYFTPRSIQNCEVFKYHLL